MAATTKSELIEVTKKEYSKLERLIETLSPDAAMKKRDDVTSIKDVIGHRAHWIDLFLGWYEDGRAGKVVYFPAEGYHWNELKRYNADLRKRQAKLGWDDAKALLSQRCTMLLEFLESHSNTDLYSGPMEGANNAWTPGRSAEAAGPSHFRSASKYIRAAIKNDAA